MRPIFSLFLFIPLFAVNQELRAQVNDANNASDTPSTVRSQTEDGAPKPADDGSGENGDNEDEDDGGGGGGNQNNLFEGLGFGVGLSLTFDVGTTRRVSEATIVDGVVRVTDEDDKLGRIMLESHYFFETKNDKWPWDGHGPFVSVIPGSDQIVEAVGLGWMMGFRRNRNSDDDNSSWNIGIGYVVEPNVDVLGDGFAANEPPPGNETTVRLKETSQEGILLMFSFAF